MEFIRSDQITNELLQKIWAGLPQREHYLRNFMRLNVVDSTVIPITVTKNEATTKSGTIRGFSDSPVLIDLDEETLLTATPFHIRNGITATIKEDKSTIRVVDGSRRLYDISAELIVNHVRTLNDGRLNLQLEAVRSMVMRKNFTYYDGKLNLTIPYYDVIENVEVTSSGDYRNDLDIATQQYESKTGLPLSYIIINNATWIKLLDKIKTENKAWGPSSNIYDTREQIGRAHVYTLGKYQILIDDTINPHDGKKWVDDDLAIFISEGDERFGKPIVINRATNAENEANPLAPAFSYNVVNETPPTIQTSVYDNMIPSLALKNAVMHYRLF